MLCDLIVLFTLDVCLRVCCLLLDLVVIVCLLLPF